jgi:hypothetical protein
MMNRKKRSTVKSWSLFFYPSAGKAVTYHDKKWYVAAFLFAGVSEGAAL